MYWTNVGTYNSGDSTFNGDGTVMTVLVGGGTPATLASGQGTQLAPEGYSNILNGLAIDGANAYWRTEYQVVTKPLMGGSITALANDKNPVSIAVDATNVYWLKVWGYARIEAVPLGGGLPVTLQDWWDHPQGDMRGLVADGGHIYWSDTGDGSHICRMAGDGTGAVVLAYGKVNVGFVAVAIAVDETSVYWLSYSSVTRPTPAHVGDVMKVAK